MHNHKGQLGPPYDPKKPITCLDCIAEILAYRADLCKKYGWEGWPESISSATLAI